MKLFTQLVGIYILLLSMFPCPEELFAVNDEAKTAAVQQTAADDDCEEDCPPFCSCACCGIQMLRTCNCVHITSPVQFAVFNAINNQLTITDIYLPIWQPPQLS